MIYQLWVNCYFTDQSALDDILDKLNDAKPSMTVVNPGQPEQQCSSIDVMHCHHDQHPPLSCTLVSHWDNCPLPP